MAVSEANFSAPLHDAKHRSAKREQGAHVWAQERTSSRRLVSRGGERNPSREYDCQKWIPACAGM